MRREICLVALSGALLLTAPAPARAPLSEVATLAQSTAVQPPASVSVPDSFPPPIVVEPAVTHGSAKVAAQSASAGTSVSSVVLAAYQSAADAVPDSCHLEVSLLAAIGQVESGNLAGRDVDTKHRATPAVLGPLLDGNPHAAIRDTDAGVYDEDSTWDRAVGPMQFIPSTWIRFGVDLDGDGVRDPQDMEDAAGSAAAYLCFAGRDLATESGLRAAILSYNHSVDYLALVLSWKEQFDVDGFGDIGDPVIVPIGTAEPDTSPTDDPPGGTTTEAGGPPGTLPPTHPPKGPPTQPPTVPPNHPPTPTPTPTRELPPTLPPTPVPTDPPTDPPTPTPTPTDPPPPTPTPTDPPPPTPTPTLPPTDPPTPTPSPTPTPIPVEPPSCEPTVLESESPSTIEPSSPDSTAPSEDPTAIPIDPCQPPVPPADGTEPSPTPTAILSAGD